MADATKDVETPRMGVGNPQYEDAFPVKAGEELFAGTMATLVGGELVKSATGDDGQAVVLVKDHYDTSNEDHLLFKCRVEWGSNYLMTIDTGSLDQSDVGKPVFALDNQTVTLTAGTNTRVGQIVKVHNATEPWVFFEGPTHKP